MPNQSLFRNAAYLVAGGAFVAVRWIVETGLTPQMYTDSNEFIALVQRPVLDLTTLFSIRPAVILILYRFVGATPMRSSPFNGSSRRSPGYCWPPSLLGP
jgi:hypothetical protein